MIKNTLHSSGQVITIAVGETYTLKDDEVMINNSIYRKIDLEIGTQGNYPTSLDTNVYLSIRKRTGRMNLPAVAVRYQEWEIDGVAQTSLADVVENISTAIGLALYSPWYDAILANNGIIENPVYIQSQYVKYSHATFINIAGCYKQGTINVAESGVWMSQKPIGTDFLLTRNTVSNTRATDFKFRNLNFNTPSVTNIPTPTVLLEPQSKNISLTNAFGENGGILGASNSLTSTDNDWFGGGFKRVLIANNGLSTLSNSDTRLAGLADYIVNNTSMSFQIYIEKGTKQFYVIRISGINTDVWFDLDNRTVHDTNGVLLNWTVENYGLGMIVKATTITYFRATPWQFQQIRGGCVNSIGSTVLASGSTYFGVCQIEAQPYNTSLIVGGGTRLADVVKPIIEPSLFSADEGVWMIEIENFSNSMMAIGDGFFNNRFDFRSITNNTEIEFSNEVDSVITAPVTLTGVNPKVNNRLYVAWKRSSTSIKVYANEVSTPLITQNSDVPIGMNKLSFQKDGNTQLPTRGVIKTQILWDSIANAESDLTWLTF
jgi:hypothetical protein